MIKLIKNYTYNNKYDYVKLFENKTQRDNFFNNFESFYESQYSNDNEHGYIKEHESFIVNYNYDYLVEHGVNYLIFNNGTRNIYAFIIKKVYENEELTRLIYEIDVFMTYQFDIELKNSFIERKVCNMNEITNFDEGIDLGEHIVVSDTTMITKEYELFGMFNGIKEHAIVFDSRGQFLNSVSVPYVTSKPMTTIDGLQYPLFFMPLKSSYADVKILPLNPNIVIADDVVGSARKLLGKPYVWGGNYPPLGDSLGTDCSGLCMWAYNDQGLLPTIGLQGRWTTYTMFNHFPLIHISDAKPGDVIFSNFNSNGQPQHVVLISNINIERVTIIEAQQTGVPIKEYTVDFIPGVMKIGRVL